MNGNRTGLMTVGELSRRTGVSVKNLRTYTDMGLIYSAGRSASNYRLFDADALWCVRLIGEFRGLGLTVAELRELARAHDDCTGAPFGRLLADRLQASRRRLRARIAELEETLDRIDNYEAAHRKELAYEEAACWDGDPRCPIGA